ncbi:DUF2029 domain-containing protein [Corynebacterium lizhenjunii]|uniref:DUF2029 domain-containing protein n=1 Tax=Corynebacterium lizhenjunii TaxID=2709394 RepID=A0A7T0PD29_9CORY|nr:DUF2029 domain-containing protein [Corynebacterium lizhenjunii]
MGRACGWPLALALFIHRVFIVAFTGTPTDDFTTVYNAVRRMLAGQPVYEQAYHHVDPLYLYNPGATVLLSPLGLITDFDTARRLFILANALAVIAALAILTRMVGRPLRGAVWPLSIAAAFATESVTNTLAFTNINGLLLLALCLFLWAFLPAHTAGITTASLPIPPSPTPRTRARGWLGGLVLGAAIVIKPQFAPLLALVIVRKDWRALAGAVATPVALNVYALWRIEATAGYREKLLPYLAHTRDYANSSWAGMVEYFHAPSWLYWAVWAATAALVAATLLVLLRWSATDSTWWALTSTGVIFTGIFFLSSLGQQYYSMWLFPWIFTAFFARSVFHTWGAWLAAFLCLAPVSWANPLWPSVGRWMDVFGATAGWLLLLVVAAASTAAWWRRERLEYYSCPHD